MLPRFRQEPGDDACLLKVPCLLTQAPNDPLGWGLFVLVGGVEKEAAADFISFFFFFLLIIGLGGNVEWCGREELGAQFGTTVEVSFPFAKKLCPQAVPTSPSPSLFEDNPLPPAI